MTVATRCTQTPATHGLHWVSVRIKCIVCGWIGCNGPSGSAWSLSGRARGVACSEYVAKTIKRWWLLRLFDLNCIAKATQQSMHVDASAQRRYHWCCKPTHRAGRYTATIHLRTHHACESRTHSRRQLPSGNTQKNTHPKNMPHAKPKHPAKQPLPQNSPRNSPRETVPETTLPKTVPETVPEKQSPSPYNIQKQEIK